MGGTPALERTERELLSDHADLAGRDIDKRGPVDPQLGRSRLHDHHAAGHRGDLRLDEDLGQGLVGPDVDAERLDADRCGRLEPHLAEESERLRSLAADPRTAAAMPRQVHDLARMLADDLQLVLALVCDAGRLQGRDQASGGTVTAEFAPVQPRREIHARAVEHEEAAPPRKTRRHERTAVGRRTVERTVHERAHVMVVLPVVGDLHVFQTPHCTLLRMKLAPPSVIQPEADAPTAHSRHHQCNRPNHVVLTCSFATDLSSRTRGVRRVRTRRTG